MMTSDHWIKKVSFILAILILFVALVQVGLSTFWPRPDYPESQCLRVYAPEDKPTQECLDEDTAVREVFNKEEESTNNVKFIVGTIISLLAIFLVLFVKFNNTIVYGLFGGAIINELFTLGFVENKNLIGFIALLVLFVVVIFFVQRKSKK